MLKRLWKVVWDGVIDWLKDARKYFFWAVAIGLFSLVPAATKAYLQIPPHSAGAWLAFALNLPRFIFLWTGENPLKAFTFSVMWSAIFILIVLLYRANEKLRQAKQSLEDGNQFRLLADAIGFDAWWPNALPASGEQWERLKASIARGDNAFVHILGANGIDTFGATTAPLYQCLSRSTASLHVILCDPNSTETKARADLVKTKFVEYKKAIQTSVGSLRDFKRKGLPVEGRYCEFKPGWKIILTSNLLWLQYYMPTDTDVVDTPIYLFSPRGDKDPSTDIYRLFRVEFERIWHVCRDNVISLR